PTRQGLFRRRHFNLFVITTGKPAFHRSSPLKLRPLMVIGLHPVATVPNTMPAIHLPLGDGGHTLLQNNQLSCKIPECLPRRNPSNPSNSERNAVRPSLYDALPGRWQCRQLFGQCQLCIGTSRPTPADDRLWP